MLQRDRIKDWQGRILGTVDTDTVTGNKIIKHFSGKILGKYDKRSDTTRDFYGRVVAKGDNLSMLLKK